jgi:ankyrin repeat protein
MGSVIRACAVRLFFVACLVAVVAMWKSSAGDAGRESLCDAAQRGDLQGLARAMDRGTPIDTKDQAGLTPLLIAIRADHPDAASFLIRHGASVGVTQGGYGTPLMLAAKNGQVEIVRELLQRGADPNQSEDLHRCSALWFAAIETEPSQDEIAKLLLDAGAHVNHATANGETALMAAASSGNIRVARMLIDAGADVNQANNCGDSALDVAGTEHNPAVASLLTRNGATSTKALAMGGNHRSRVY